ncbi:MAG TPA: hypothetical protein VKA67_03180, partial [Verrucomicrobiae bacterium]|nr:hypothetical protein [Verrucomicrobiae bacterium]
SLVVHENNLFTPFLAQPLIARIGVISYGIYLYHLIALDVVMRITDRAGLTNKWVVFFGYFALACLFAEISYRTLEAYFRRFRPKRERDTGKERPAAA